MYGMNISCVCRSNLTVLCLFLHTVIGETKDISYHYRVGDVENRMTRVDALKFQTDEEYEVISPFSNKCKACSNKKK